MNTTGATKITTSAAVTSLPWSNVTGFNMYAVDVLAFSATSCSLSFIGSAVIFATFVVLPEIRNFTRKLMICLTFADLITATAYLMSVIRYANLYKGNVDWSEESIVCKVQSFFTTYSSLVSFILTSIIAVYIFDTVVNRSNRLGTTKWLVVFNIVSWVIPGKYLKNKLENVQKKATSKSHILKCDGTASNEYPLKSLPVRWSS